MSLERKAYMGRAMELAFSRMGTTSPNPPVGALIVRDGVILSEGCTCACGCDHAEVDAIKNAKIPLRGAELYVTLEPCCHYGKTPPCTEAIIGSGIARVYVPVLDPNPAVSGKGIASLREAGIEVIMLPEMAEHAGELIRPFRKYIERGTPYVIHKSAMTLDGRIASSSGDSKWISSEPSRYIAHRLRSRMDAILIGKNTYMADRPSLTPRPGSFPEEIRRAFAAGRTRISGYDSIVLRMLLESGMDGTANPLRVLMGAPDKIDMRDEFFRDRNFLLAVSEEEGERLMRSGTAAAVPLEGKQLFVASGKARAERVASLLKELHSRGIMCVMVEGGGGLAGAFYDAGEIDECFYFIAPRLLGSGVSSIQGKGASLVSDAMGLDRVSTAMIGEDVLYHAHRKE